MKITKVVSTIVNVPRNVKLTTSYGSKDSATTVIVELETDEGLNGIGQTAVDAPFYGEPAASIKTNIDVYLTPAIIGCSPLDIEHVTDVMNQAVPGHLSAKAGIDLALWDLKGKALGVPVYQLLGGKLRDGVSLMSMVHRADPQTMAEEANERMSTPYSVLKMKVGIDVNEDVARFRAVSEALDGRAVIQVDGNGGYSLGDAIRSLSQMDRIGGLGMIEQPVKRLDEMAALGKRFGAPIMADESIYSPDDAIEVVKRDAAQVALLKITKHGGILNVLKIAHIAEASGIDLSVAIYYDVIAAAAAHIAAALPAVTWPSPPTGLDETILTESIEPTGLLMKVPERPGFGVEIDRDKIRHYSADL
ncbi:MAG: enolase C-terminal domain-like protein [Pseudomonadota bacterium]